MADTVTDSLTGSLRTSLLWTRVDTQEVGAITDKGSGGALYPITDGHAAGQADLIFCDTREIAADTVEMIDLSDISQTRLGVVVPFTFTAIRCVRVTNNSTTVGKNLLFGVDPGRPTLVHAANIGPGSEFVTINHIDSWVVTNDNKEIYICNPNATSISYSLYLLGTAYD